MILPLIGLRSGAMVLSSAWLFFRHALTWSFITQQQTLT